MTMSRGAFTRSRSRLLVLFILLAWAPMVVGQTTVWTGVASSSWGDPANWTAGVPTASTDAVIMSGTPSSPSTAGVSSADCRDLTLHAGATMSVTAPVNINRAGMIYGSLGGMGFVRFVGANGTLHTTGGGPTLPNVEVASSGTFHNHPFSVAGTLRHISGSWSFGAVWAYGAVEFLGGTVVTQVGGFLDAAQNVTWAGSSCTSAPQINCAGNWVADAGFNPGNNVVIFDGPGTRSISGAGNFWDISVASGSTVLPTVALHVDHNYNVNGSLTLLTPIDSDFECNIHPGGIMNVPDGTHTFSGQFFVANGGTLATPSTSIIRFDGGSTNFISGGSGPTFPNVEVASSGTFHNHPFSVAGTLRHISGSWSFGAVWAYGAVEFLGGTVVTQVGGLLDAAQNVTWAGSSCTSAPQINCAGNWVADAGFNPGNNVVIFDGPGTRSISGAGNFWDISVASGSTVLPTVALHVDHNYNVNGSLTLLTPIDSDFECNIHPGGIMNVPDGTHTFSGQFFVANGGTLATPSTSIIRFDGGSTNFISGGSGPTFPNVEVASSGTFHNHPFSVAGTLRHISGSWSFGAVWAYGAVEFLGGTVVTQVGGLLDAEGDVTFSGTICTSPPQIRCAGNWMADSGFNPTSNVVILDGSTARTIGSLPAGSMLSFHDFQVDSGVKTAATDLTIRAATIQVQTAGTFSTGSKRVAIHRPAASTPIQASGTIEVQADGELALGPGVSVFVGNSGALRIVGTCALPAIVSGEAGGGYAMTIRGLLAASNFVFKQMGPAGIRVLASAGFGAAPNDLRGGTFDYPSAVPGAVLLDLERQYSAAFYYLTFLNTPGHPGAKNVRTANGPFIGAPISFTNFSGAFSGPAFEDDPDNLIAWNPPDPSLPLGLCDTDPPVVTITAPADGAIFGSTSCTVSASLTDENAITVTSTPAGISASLAAGGGSVSGTLGLAIEGSNTLTVTGTDQFGNVGGTSVTVIRDTTAPSVTIDSPTEGAVFGSAEIVVTVTVADATATQIAIGGTTGTLPAGGGQTSSAVTLVEGPNAISVTATDAAGNPTTVVRNVILDSTAPVVMITSPSNGAAFGPGESPIAVTASIDDATDTTVTSSPPGVSGSVPGGGGTAAGSVALVEGSNTIQVMATDAAGQTGQASISVILDTTAPQAALVSPAAGSIIRGTVDFHATAEDVAPGTGISRVDVRVDGNLFASITTGPYETTFDTTTLSDGTHTFTATAVDGKNNSASASATVLVDNTVPTVAISQPVDGSLVAGSLSFVANGSDAGSGLARFTMRANGSPPSTDGSTTYVAPVATDVRTSQVITTLVPDGPMVVTVTVEDAAGNAASTSVTVYVDNTAPSRSLITPIDGSVVSGVMLIQGTANDPNLAVLGIFVESVLIASTTSSSIATTFDTALVVDGLLTVTLVAIDSLGNSSTSSATVTVDNIPGFILTPRTLNLKSKGGDTSVTAHLEGSSVGLLIPTESHDIELRVPGGSPVPSTAGFSGDDAISDSDGDQVGELTIKFNRQALIASIRAGVAAGMIQPNSQVTVTLVSAGRVIGTDVIRIIGP